MKSIELIVGGGSVRVEWNEDIHDLTVKLSLAKVMQCDLSKLHPERILDVAPDSNLPTPGAVVDYAEGRMGKGGRLDGHIIRSMPE